MTELHTGLEVQVRTKDPDDGCIIGIQPAGDIITPAEFSDWMDNGNMPDALLSRLPRYCSRPWIKRLYELKYLQDKSVDELVSKYSHNWIGTIPDKKPNEKQALYDKMVKDAIAKCRKMVIKLKAANVDDVERGFLEGFDTKWGDGDLKKYMIICVNGLTQNDVNDIMFRDFDVSDFAADRLPGGEKGRGYKIDWKALLSAPTIDKVLEKDTLVSVKRTSLQLKDVIVKIPGREF